jgi:hypothetical protein
MSVGPMARYKPEQIVTLLRRVEVEIANGRNTLQTCKERDFSKQTYFGWRKQFVLRRL